MSPKQYAQALYQAVHDVSSKKDTKVLIENFIKILVKNGMLSKVNQIIDRYEKYSRDREGVVKVSVVSANEFLPQDKKDIISAFEKLTGKKIELYEEVRKDILGGAIFRIDDGVLDASLKSQLMDLQKQLTH